MIAEIAGHPNFWRVVKREKAHVDRVRLLTLQFAGRFESVVAEHKRIVDAHRARVEPTPRRRRCSHLQRVLPGSRRSAPRHPDYFEDETAPAARQRRAARAQS